MLPEHINIMSNFFGRRKTPSIEEYLEFASNLKKQNISLFNYFLEFSDEKTDMYHAKLNMDTTIKKYLHDSENKGLRTLYGDTFALTDHLGTFITRIKLSNESEKYKTLSDLLPLVNGLTIFLQILKNEQAVLLERISRHPANQNNNNNNQNSPTRESKKARVCSDSNLAAPSIPTSNFSIPHSISQNIPVTGQTSQLNENNSGGNIPLDMYDEESFNRFFRNLAEQPQTDYFPFDESQFLGEEWLTSSTQEISQQIAREDTAPPSLGLDSSPLKNYLSSNSYISNILLKRFAPMENAFNLFKKEIDKTTEISKLIALWESSPDLREYVKGIATHDRFEFIFLPLIKSLLNYNLQKDEDQKFVSMIVKFITNLAILEHLKNESPVENKFLVESHLNQIRKNSETLRMHHEKMTPQLLCQNFIKKIEDPIEFFTSWQNASLKSSLGNYLSENADIGKQFIFDLLSKSENHTLYSLMANDILNNITDERFLREIRQAYYVKQKSPHSILENRLYKLGSKEQDRQTYNNNNNTNAKRY